MLRSGRAATRIRATKHITIPQPCSRAHSGASFLEGGEGHLGEDRAATQSVFCVEVQAATDSKRLNLYSSLAE